MHFTYILPWSFKINLDSARKCNLIIRDLVSAGQNFQSKHVVIEKFRRSSDEGNFSENQRSILNEIQIVAVCAREFKQVHH